MCFATRPIDAGWLNRWALSIADCKLRSDISGSSRFAGRIEKDLLWSEFGIQRSADTPLHIPPEVEAACGVIDEGFFEKVGLAWYAPVLSKLVLGPDRQRHLLPTDRTELQFMMLFRHHIAVARLKVPTHAGDLTSAGRTCFFAWLQNTLPDGIERFCLRMPPCPEMQEVMPMAAQQAALFSSVLDRLEIVRRDAA